MLKKFTLEIKGVFPQASLDLALLALKVEDLAFDVRKLPAMEASSPLKNPS